MLEIRIDISSAIQGLNRLESDIQKAWDAAVRETATRILLPAVRAAVSLGPHAPIGMLGSKTGKLRNQLQPKFWTNRHTGLLGASIKVRGDRAFIMNIHEKGTKSHGGRGTKGRKISPGAKGDRGPLPARKVFATVWRTIHGNAERSLLRSFERNLETHLKASGF